MDDFTKQHGSKSYLEETSKCHIFHTGARADRYGRRYEPPTNDKGARLDCHAPIVRGASARQFFAAGSCPADNV